MTEQELRKMSNENLLEKLILFDRDRGDEFSRVSGAGKWKKLLKIDRKQAAIHAEILRRLAHYNGKSI